MGYLMMLIAVLASAFMGGCSYGVTECEGNRKSFCALMGLLVFLVVFLIVTTSAAYAPRIILGY